MILPKQEMLDESCVKDYESLYKESIANPEAFWEKIAKELEWYKPWNKVLEWNYPYARWFVGGQTNIVYNCLDRHLKTPTKNKLAIIWEGQNCEERRFTYGELNDEVCRFANGLKSLGLKKGDHVTIYLPRIPEQDIAMLACAKIGLVHSIVFSGFSVEALKNRIIDAESKVVICCNSYPYKEKTIESKKNVDEAVKDCPTVQNIIVVKRVEAQTEMKEGRDIWWSDIVANQSAECATEIMESIDPLYILYTSGSTGKPKGVVHCHGGYMVGIYITLKWVFNLNAHEKQTLDARNLKLDLEARSLKLENQTSNLQPQDPASKIQHPASNNSDIYWCTADAGWVTGHSYIVYSPLINGITTFIYESVPDYPDPGKWWSLVEKYRITKFYTAPTAVRALMRYGDEWPKKYDLSSLKILGTVGEPINPEAWLWYYKNIGREKCPIMDTWWQTETGMMMITPLPSVPLKPGSCFKPFFGVEADVVDEKGNPVPVNTQGYLIIKKPWPAMLLDVYNNPQKYRETYFEKIQNSKLQNFLYFTGDSAKIDNDGYFWIIGRNDDVIKVSGHRLGSAELESAFVSHPSVAEAAAIGKPHEVKGESIKVFVILKQGISPSDQLKTELVQQVRKMIGPIATPDEIEFVDKLPKTRSGKIMRRVLKAKELGLPIGDISTLES